MMIFRVRFGFGLDMAALDVIFQIASPQTHGHCNPDLPLSNTMTTIVRARSPFFGALLFVLMVLSAKAEGQEPKTPLKQADDVIRIETELVQTDVTVVDKRGHFIDGLKPEQFELRIDQGIHPIAFFERVTTGSAEESKMLAAARKVEDSVPAKPNDPTGGIPARGRVIFFFVDDVHLAGDSLTHAREGLLRFVE